MDQKVLVIGDPHFKISGIKEARLFSNKIKDLVQKIQPNLVVILGDLHDGFERIHSHVTREICYLFNSILGSMLDPTAELIYIIGNHDAVNNKIFLSDDHAFLPFGKWPRLTIVDSTYTCNPGNGQNQFTFVPYVPPGRLYEALEKSFPAPDWQQSAVIFAHQEFRDVQLGPQPSKLGDEWPESNPLVISGHIHEHQWLQRNILYVGSPYQISFGEEGEKTVTLINFTDIGPPMCTQISLGMPRRISRVLTIEEAKEFIAPENTKVRIYLTATTEELTAFKKSKKYKELEREFKIIPFPTDKVTAKRNTAGRGFMQLLTESLASESKTVQDTFAEIMNARKA